MLGHLNWTALECLDTYAMQVNYPKGTNLQQRPRKQSLWGTQIYKKGTNSMILKTSRFLSAGMCSSENQYFPSKVKQKRKFLTFSFQRESVDIGIIQSHAKDNHAENHSEEEVIHTTTPSITPNTILDTGHCVESIATSLDDSDPAPGTGEAEGQIQSDEAPTVATSDQDGIQLPATN